MVVCRYFQQGNCRFGERCRFEHPGDSGNVGYDTNSNNAYKWYGGGSNRGVTYKDTVSTNNRYDALSNQDNRQSKSKATGGIQSFSTSDMINTISSDMETWNRSTMWQFSCYSYFKDCSCIPGFDDISPEEMRLEAYEAQKSGNVQHYLQKVKDLLNRITQLKSELARPSMQVKQKLTQLMEEDRRSIERGSQDQQSTGKTDGLFSSSQQQSSGLFGKQQTSSTSVFGQTNSGLFGNNQSSGGLFGKSQSSDMSEGSSVFGNTQSGGSSVFGNTQSGESSVFGNTQSGGSSVFGNNQSTAGGLFGKSQSTTGNTGGLFGNNQSSGTNAGGLFGSTSQPGGSIFGNSQPSTGLFGNNQPQSSVFGTGSQSNSTGSIFGGTSNSSQGLSKLSAPAFGQSVTAFIPVNPVQSDATPINVTALSSNKSLTYTPLSELTPEERKQYEASHFSEGNLPTRPPPKELC